MARGKAAIAVSATGVGLLLFVLPLRHVTLTSIGGLGLISVLPVASLAGLALLVMAFVAMLAGRRPRPAMLAAMLMAVIFCLDGAAAIAEPLPRFATAYQIAGFVGYIGHTGHVAPGAAAYFSWPGFFALIAFAAGAAGAHSLLPLLAWWPVIIDALCLLPFMLITRSLGIGWRARWLAALLFCVGNWVGQDYFSPQSFNYLLYLVFVAILLTWFGVRPAGKEPGPATGSAQRAILLLLLIGIFVTSTVSHQLTPFLMLATCTGLVMTRRCTLRGLPVLLGVILIGWISVATVAYWSGHLSGIIGEIGHLGGNISASVGDRLIGTPVHQLALYVRIVLPAAMVGLAVLGLIRRWRGRADNRALLVLLCVPVTAAAVQNYGGEISLRVYLFALPAAAVLAACLFFPGTKPGQRSGASRSPVLAVIAAGLVAVSLSGLFLVARYGNEAFEQTPRGELAAMDYIYSRAASGITVAWLSPRPGVNATPEMPWQYRDITGLNFLAVAAPRNPAATAAVAATLRGLRNGSYLILTATQEAYLREAGSYPARWGSQFRARMATVRSIRVVYANRDAVVYAVRRPYPAPSSEPPAYSGGSGSAATTWWTVVEAAILACALFILVGRELIRLCFPRWRRLLRPLALAALPVLALLLLVVIERFAMLS